MPIEAKPTNAKQRNAKQINAKHRNAKQSKAKQSTANQSPAKQSKSKQVEAEDDIFIVVRLAHVSYCHRSLAFMSITIVSISQSKETSQTNLANSV